MIYKEELFEVGDTLEPITKAGLCLADVPVNGDQNQKRNTVCVFRGRGVVLEVHDCVIDYDTWTYENEKGQKVYDDIGKVHYRDYLIKCDAGVGWGGGVEKVK
jgi:hypothetical protein